MAKVIIGLAGEIASGKGTAAQYFKEKYGASLHRFSTVLRDVLKRLGLEESRENMQKISTMLRGGFGDDILAKAMYSEVMADKQEVIVIDGVRRYPDIKYLSQIPEFSLVYIQTDLEKRFERIVKRGENVDDNQKTFEQFKKDNEQEAEAHIRELKDKSQAVVDNNQDEAWLYQQLDQLIKR